MRISLAVDYFSCCQSLNSSTAVMLPSDAISLRYLVSGIDCCSAQNTNCFLSKEVVGVQKIPIEQ
jgi:hypothetical protein